MKDKSGFTLVELLAVIVVIAALALVATPIIIRTIDNAKKNTFQNSVQGIKKIIEMESLKGDTSADSFTIIKGVIRNGKGENMNSSGGTDETGTASINYKGNISIAIHNDRWCAIKNGNSKELEIKEYNDTSCESQNIPTEGAKLIADKNTSGNTEGLYKDPAGNIRYRGSASTVKNHIYFNGTERWRIVGIFDGKLKLVRDTTESGIWTTNGKNNWETSTLSAHLNTTVYNGINPVYQSMITDNLYYLGGFSTTGVDTNTMYNLERGSKTASGAPSTWNGKLALLYASDYGYAAGTSCTGNLNAYNSDNCKNNNWLYKATYEWLLTPQYSSVAKAAIVNSTGFVDQNTSIGVAQPIRPVLYLRSDTPIVSGNGTSASPYKII